MKFFQFALLLVVSSQALGLETEREGLDFFETRIRPQLIKHCYECHSAQAVQAQKLRGKLLLDSRDATLQGGESGPAVVPGKPAESLLVSALKHESFEMPPKGKLPDAVVADFVKWVEMGAPDPREGTAPAASMEVDIEAGRQHWAFQPLQRPEAPQPQDGAWTRNPIDRFVRVRQETSGVTPNGVADPRILLRRAYFDLIGLPPTVEQTEEFMAAASEGFDQAYQALIDSLLDSEHFGERWARHWLDVTRFAESHGYAFDGDRPHAWHYRDFVIRALNADMPYTEFVRQQLAGDLLGNANPRTAEEAIATVEMFAATGFLVAGPFTTQQTQKERERSRYEQLDDIVATLGTSLLGLTIGCARCHSHKFDPLPQHDYYRLVSCFSEVGFSDAAINRKPEEHRAALEAFNADHAPLTQARSAYEAETLGSHFESWLGDPTSSLPDLQFGSWHHAGPFPAANFDAAFEQSFPPEEMVDLAASGAEDQPLWSAQPEWRDGVVHNTLAGANAANYLFREIDAVKPQRLLLNLGSDDAIKVWLNGKDVLSKKVSRGAAPNQESVEISLEAGRNELLLKIVNGGGPSGFYFRPTPLTEREQGPWHHIGPFQSTDFDAAYAQVFAPELEIELEQSYSEDKLKWTPQPDWKDAEAHNDKLTGNHCANYLYREIVCSRPAQLALSLGSDDGIKVWVNGRRVLDKKVARNVAAADQEKVTVQLAPGRNAVLMKIVNGGGKTGFYFAASEAALPQETADLLAVAERNEEQNKKLLEWYKGYDQEWLALNQAVTRHEVQRPKPEQVRVFSARAKGTTYQFGENTYKVFHLRRGNSDNKEDEAEPGFLRVLMRSEDLEDAWLADVSGESKEQRPSRLALTDWLADTERGSGHLLARVIVNRLWFHHFGRGIVTTPSDFGTRGEPPTHPELLEWLAAELVESGWRLKHLHKLMMTSSTYMQAGRDISASRATDPENLLWWRRGSRRLEAEAIRDSLLAVSGTLDRTMYGKGTLNPKSPRRSIYFTVKRSQLVPFLQLFDAPDAMQGIATREESTVAPQALALLNSPIVRELATRFAERVQAGGPGSLPELVERVYRIALSRRPTEAELVTMVEFVQQQQSTRADENDAELKAIRDLCQLILCMNEFVYID